MIIYGNVEPTLEQDAWYWVKLGWLNEPLGQPQPLTPRYGTAYTNIGFGPYNYNERQGVCSAFRPPKASRWIPYQIESPPKSRKRH